MYHPESVKGEINELSFYYIYAVLNLIFSIAVVVVSRVRVPFVSLKSNNKNKAVSNNVKTDCFYKESVIKFNMQDFLFFLRRCFGVVFVAGVFVYFYSLGYALINPFAYVLNVIKNGRMAHFANDGFSVLLINVSFYMMASVAVFAYLDYKLKRCKSVFSYLIIFLVALWTVSSGGRQFLIMYASGYIYGRFEERTLFKGHFLLISFMLGFLLIVWQVLRKAIFLGSTESLNVEGLFFVFLQGDFSYFYYSSLEAVRHFYDDGLIYFGNFYRNLLFLVLPTEWTFGLKQRDLSSLFSVAYQSDVSIRGGNYPPGLIGLFVLNFGWFGWLLIGVPFLMLMKFLDSLPKNISVKWLSGSVFLFVIFQFSRGTLMGFYQWAMLFILYFFFIILFYARTRFCDIFYAPNSSF